MAWGVKMKMVLVNIDKSISAYVFFVTVIFVLLILFAASDFRGTDQYWYMADVEALLEGGKTTNNVYPVQILSPEVRIPCPFMHNILNLYLVLPAARIVGAFRGWIATNILASIVTALLIALLVAKVADKWVAALAYTGYLLLPLTIWQSSQPLAEATIAPFVALGLLTYVWSETNKRLWALTFVVVCAAYYCRASFLPLLFVIPVAYLAQNRPVRIKNVLAALGFLGLAVFVVIIGKMIFVQSMPTSFRRIITNAIPGITGNSDVVFSLSPRPIVIEEMWLKASRYLSYQFWSPNRSSQIFYLPFNVLAAISLCLCFTKKSRLEVRLCYCTMTLLLLHIATIIVHQNQFRYLLVVSPVALAGAAVMINKIKFLQSRQIRLGLKFGLIILLIASNIPLVARLRQEGFRERELRTALNSIFDRTIANNESVIVDASDRYNQIWGYVLRPRTVIYVKSRYKCEQYQTMREKGDAKWLLCPLKSSLVESFNIFSPPILKELPYPYEDYGLFRL